MNKKILMVLIIIGLIGGYIGYKQVVLTKTLQEKQEVIEALHTEKESTSEKDEKNMKDQKPLNVFKRPYGVMIKTGDFFLEIMPLESDTFRINYKENGRISGHTEVIGRTSWENAGDYKLIEEKNMVKLSTSQVTAVYDHIEGTIRFYNTSDEMLLKQLVIDELSEVTFQDQKNGHFYGINGYDAWENSEKLLLREEGGIVAAGEQGDCGAPFLWTNEGYGILIDTIGGRFSIEEQEIHFTGNSKVNLDYYVFFGKPKKLMQSMFKVSGTYPMFPKWTLGFNNSEWGLDEAELQMIIDEYRKRDLPIDYYTLDFDWKAWGEDNYGEFRWNDEKFPSGESGKLAKELLKQGVKLTGIYKPRIIVQDTIQGAYAKKHGYFVEGQQPYSEYFSHKLANDIDFSNANAGAWYFNQTKQSIDTGIQGFWNDEADERYGDLGHLLMQKALYLGQRGYNNKRVWSINRNFYLGAQKYAYAMWSGDINSGFHSMANQRERMLSAVNLGAMKWGMDTGGFNGLDPTAQNYARWIQFSAFTPIFRVHSSLDKQRQPWIFGEKAEKASKMAMDLRYRLIPYIYSYERQAYETGLGIVRPLVFDYPKDAKVANTIDSWMFGDALLVSPIVQEDQKIKKIYLPKGKWIDYFTGETYAGNQTIEYTCDTETWLDIPLFIKSGAILSMQEAQAYIGEKKIDSLQLEFFPAKKKTEFMIYDDDGMSYDYESGEYYRQMTSMQKSSEETKIVFDTPSGSYQTKYKTYDITVYQSNVAKVVVNGEAIPFNTIETKYGEAINFTVESAQGYEILIK